MSARDRLWELYQFPDSASAFGDALDDYAHELAQKQRNWDAEAEGYTDPQMAVYAVADLIDPEAQR